MKSNRLIITISLLFASIFSLPKVLFYFADNKDPYLNNIINVSIEDIIVRYVLLFVFSYLILKLNLFWIYKKSNKFKTLLFFALNIFILFIWIMLFNIIHEHVFRIHDSVISQKINNILYFVFLIILLLISKVLNLIDESKITQLEKEQLKQKNLQSELEALKNQLNPHFLFNSLNSLILLVRQNPVEAEIFINNLSNVLRNLLQSSNMESVSIAEELKILNSYSHLLKQRFRENINVVLNIDPGVMEKKIPTHSLQILLENAVKHNEITSKYPLFITLYSESDWVCAKNPIRPRNHNEESTKIGLKNLNDRSRIIAGREIEIHQIDDNFVVKVPIL